jgi:hypothetical protein
MAGGIHPLPSFGGTMKAVCTKTIFESNTATMYQEVQEYDLKQRDIDILTKLGLMGIFGKEQKVEEQKKKGA